VNSRYLENRANARQRRGAECRPRLGPHNRRSGYDRRSYVHNVKIRPFASLLYIHFNARADNWTSALLASSIRKHLIGLKALITALNCANVRSYPY